MSNHIGTTKIETASGMEEVPVFDPADLDEPGWFRVETPAGTGAVRLVDISDATLDEYRVQTPGGLKGVATSLGDIPDSVVTRPVDNNSTTINEDNGVRISSNVEWPAIGAEISQNTTGATRAYLYRVSDSQLLGETDISGLSAGDSFTLQLSENIVSGEEYNFVIDAEGGSYTIGYYDSSSYPYTSSDGDLSIVDGATGASGTVPDVGGVNNIGNTGF